MTQLKRTLHGILTTYPVFEDNQVLTAAQLNGAVEYLNEQGRFTRIDHIGVGIACGLHVSFDKGTKTVHVSKGLGITTDGDHVCVPDDEWVFNRYKVYGEGTPTYDPLMKQDVRISTWELVRDTTKDEVAFPLGEFDIRNQTPKNFLLADMVVVLLVESYTVDHDLCSALDCKNLGQEVRNTKRVLLVHRDDVGAFCKDKEIPTLDKAARLLPPLDAARPPLADVSDINGLVTKYQDSCNTILNSLKPALHSISVHCHSFLSDIWPADWEARRQALAVPANKNAAQYYYDYLKDLVATYDTFRAELFGDTSICVATLSSFPKHLVLGGISSGETFRTGFYPSRTVAASREDRAHARFLFVKLHAMLGCFKLPADAKPPIRMTPSMGEDRSLEERAIPFYYDPTAGLHEKWCFDLSRQNKGARNYSYHADAYGGQTKPLNLQIGRFSFFRIEGHVGHEVDEAVQEIEKQIRANSLPIKVRKVRFGKATSGGSSGGTTTTKPPYTDLHKFHRGLRYDLAKRLDKLAEALRKTPPGCDPGGPIDTASKIEKLAKNVDNAVTTLKKKYTDYSKDTAWQENVSHAVEIAPKAAQYALDSTEKSDIALAIPANALMVGMQMQLLAGLDLAISEQKLTKSSGGTKSVDLSLFGPLHDEHPGLEHFGGVCRGGTFVLVHDDGGTVVADFMLPYPVVEPQVVIETEEPPIEDGGESHPPFQIHPPPEWEVTLRPPFRKPIPEKPGDWWQHNMADKWIFVTTALDILKEATNPGAIASQPAVTSDRIKEGRLRDIARRVEAAKLRVDVLREETIDPAGAPVGSQTMLEKAQEALADTAVAAAAEIAAMGVDVTRGTDGFAVMSVITNSVVGLTNKTAIQNALAGFDALPSKVAVSEQMDTMVKAMNKLVNKFAR